MILLKGCLLGGVIGLLYDLFRIMRRCHSFQKISIVIQDIVFFSLAALMTLLFIIAVNRGQLRWFIIISQLVGAWLYFYTLSPVIYAFGVMLVRQLQLIVAWIVRLFNRLVWVHILRTCKWAASLFDIYFKKIIKK